MGLIATNTAVAYVNFGRWVADCPTSCGSAWELQPGEMIVQCSECRNIAPVQWPPWADEIWAALMERPLPRTRNWFPKDHPLAIASGSTHGETPDELLRQTREYMGEQISPFWSETFDNGDPKQRDCDDCVKDIPHETHWSGLKKQDLGGVQGEG